MPKSLLTLLVLGSVFSACTVRALDQKVDDAIQAIQQAPDPSAVVAAYANGFAIDRNNAKLYDAYLSRMVDLGMPEIAFHQAQTLTTLQDNNGLAWGVVAYVDARRGQMPEAISAINLAGQFAPDNKFVQHTAGELVAWYDFKAEKAQIPESVRDGLTSVRELLNKQPEFTDAYNAAQKAYQTQPASTSEASQPAPVQSAVSMETSTQPAPLAAAPSVPQPPLGDQIAPLGYAPSPAPPAYYYPPDYYPDYSGVYLDWGPNYCYDWGAGWVAPVPWYWWQPCGFWGGCAFFPFVGISFAFCDSHDSHHFHHDGHDGHGDHFTHGASFDHSHNPAAWHNGTAGHNAFFGTPTRPSASTAQWARAGSARSVPSAAMAGSANAHWWNNARQPGAVATASVGERATEPSAPANRGSLAGPGMLSERSGASATIRNNGNVASLGVSRPSVVARSPAPIAPPAGAWSGSQNAYRNAPASGNAVAGRSYYTPSYSRSTPVYPAQSYNTTPAYRAPSYSAPRYAMGGNSSSFHGYSGWHGAAPMSAAPRSFGGSPGGFGGGSSFGGGVRSGVVGGGGFHGGGFGGGGFHGGGGGVPRR